MCLGWCPVHVVSFTHKPHYIGMPDGFNEHDHCKCKDKQFEIADMVNITTWNVRGLYTEEYEIQEEQLGKPDGIELEMNK